MAKNRQKSAKIIKKNRFSLQQLPQKGHFLKEMHPIFFSAFGEKKVKIFFRACGALYRCDPRGGGGAIEFPVFQYSSILPLYLSLVLTKLIGFYASPMIPPFPCVHPIANENAMVRRSSPEQAFLGSLVPLEGPFGPMGTPSGAFGPRGSASSRAGLPPRAPPGTGVARSPAETAPYRTSASKTPYRGIGAWGGSYSESFGALLRYQWAIDQNSKYFLKNLKYI